MSMASHGTDTTGQKKNLSLEPSSGDSKNVEVDISKRKKKVSGREGEKAVPASEKKKEKCVTTTRTKCEDTATAKESPHSKCVTETDGTYMSTLQTMFKEDAPGDEDKVNFKKPLRRPRLTTENTYRLEPKKRFLHVRIEKMLQEILTENLSDMRYCSKTALKTCTQLAETIRTRILELEYDRYKFVVHVALGSMNRQGFCNAFKHLGDAKRDSYAHANFINRHIFVAASVHAIYYE